MVDQSENTDLKIVDFGLSKIIGPNETSLDPFGTLVSLRTKKLKRKSNSDLNFTPLRLNDLTFVNIVLRSTRGLALKTLR